MTPAQEAGAKLQEILTQYKTQSIPCLVFLSGGSALQLLEFVDGSMFGSQDCVTVADERYSSDPKINNFAQLAQTGFFSQAINGGCSSIDTRIAPTETQDQLATRFSTSIQNWMAQHPTGKIIFTVGVGVDGHTLGIMPYPEKSEWFTKTFDYASNLVVAYDATGKNPYPLRVTTTFPLLRQASAVIGFIAGEKKRLALHQISAQSGSLATTPARIIRELTKTLYLFTDLPV